MRNARIHVAGVVALLAALAGGAEAAVVFTDISPPAEGLAPAIEQVAVHPLDGNRLIAASNGRVQVSRDGGATWRTTASTPGFADRLFAHLGRPGVVFLQGTTLYFGIGVLYSYSYTLVSEDFGETWTEIANDKLVKDELVMSPFASDPNRPEHLLATKRLPGFGISSAFINSPPTHVALVESLDGGESWSSPFATFPILARSGIRSIQGPTPATPQRIFFTTFDGGGYVSIDGGKGWSAFPFRPGGHIFWVQQDPANASVIYASAELPDVGRGIVRSTDSGNTWQMIYPIDQLGTAFGAANYGELAIDPVRSNRLWLSSVRAGVLLSEDRGASWQAVGFLPERYACSPNPCTSLDPNTIVSVVVASPTDSAQVYLIWKGRLYRGVLTPRKRVAVEYQYGDRFWITGDAAEAISQDYRANEARRTGQRFGLWGPLDAPAGAVGICRFQGNPAHGQESRFIAVEGSECDIVKGSPAFVLEGEGEYFAIPPTATGGCAEGLVAVRRFNNLESNVNHRYVSDASVAAEMRASGWYDEGVRLCARPLGSDE
jgi:hypothetical protein